MRQSIVPLILHHPLAQGSARRYRVTSAENGCQKDSIAKFQSISMTVTSSHNHVATQNNVMMNSVAVDTEIDLPSYA